MAPYETVSADDARADRLGRWLASSRGAIEGAASSARCNFACVATVLFVAYTITYFGLGAAPGNNPASPLGWLGWWDQSQYFRSAKAFAELNFSVSEHWYPIGYDLVLAPFILLAKSHAFYLPDLAFLLCIAASFLEIARVYGLPRGLALATLAIGLAPSAIVFQQYAIPWNTTMGAAILTGAALTYIRIVDSGLSAKRGACLGALGALLAFTRPSDGFALVPLALHVAWIGLRRPDGKAIATSLAAFILVFGAGFAIYLCIYGLHASPYMQQSARIGLRWALIPFRAYVMLISPAGFFGGGIGLIPLMPWAAIGFIGVFYTAVSRRSYAALNVSVIVFVCNYLSYPDFWPGNIWRFLAVHYLCWALLMSALFGVVMVVDLFRSRSLLRVGAVLAPVVIGLAFEYAAIDVPFDGPERTDRALTVHLPQPQFISGGHVAASAGWNLLFDESQHIDVDGRRLINGADYHAIPAGGGFNFVFTTPHLSHSITVSAPSGTSFGPSAEIVLFRGALRVRGLSDWKGPKNHFMP
jgi:hypothetical protein